MQHVKFILTWFLLIAVGAGGVASQSLLPQMWEPGGKAAWVLIVEPIGFFATLSIICFTPIWILLSKWRVKKAIDMANEPDYDRILTCLRLNGGFPLYPSLRYQEIVELLIQLAKAPTHKPSLPSSGFAQYFVTSGQGYLLNWEGKAKMIDHINRGLMSASFMDDLAQRDFSRAVFKLIRIPIAILALLFALNAIIQFLSRH